MAIEIEKKYRLTARTRQKVADSLLEMEAEFRGEDLEENTLFINADLIEKRAVVRIRKTETRTTIAFKQRTESLSDAKHQIEFETEVKDADSARSILENIGLRATLIYEKRRRTYRLRSAEVMLDELPFGLFMEIEGSITAIAEAEMILGIEDLETEPETYPRLTARFGVKNGETIEARFAPA